MPPKSPPGQHALPLDPSSMTRRRQRIGAERLELPLAETLAPAQDRRRRRGRAHLLRDTARTHRAAAPPAARGPRPRQDLRAARPGSGVHRRAPATLRRNAAGSPCQGQGRTSARRRLDSPGNPARPLAVPSETAVISSETLLGKMKPVFLPRTSIRTHEFACCDADSCESGERRCRPVRPVPAHPCADGAYPPSRSAPHAPSAASPPASRRSRTASSRSPTTRRFNANATASRSPSPASRTADASSHATTAAPPPSSAPSPSPPSSSSGSGNES